MEWDNTMNEFEKYPDLTEMMREYASFGHFSNWQRFTEVINDALQKATEQSSPDAKPLIEALEKIRSMCTENSQGIWNVATAAIKNHNLPPTNSPIKG